MFDKVQVLTTLVNTFALPVLLNIKSSMGNCKVRLPNAPHIDILDNFVVQQHKGESNDFANHKSYTF